MVHFPSRGPGKPPLAWAAPVLAFLFLKFQVCGLVDGRFVLRDEYFYIRQDLIGGYEVFPGIPGEQCIKLGSATGNRTVYVKAGPEVINTINRGLRPR